MSTVIQVLPLAARSMHSIDDVSGLQLRCEAGTLWLTLDHDPRDVILEAGDTFLGDSHRRGLVYALGDARLSVRPCPAAAPDPAPARTAAAAS